MKFVQCIKSIKADKSRTAAQNNNGDLITDTVETKILNGHF